MRISVIVPTLNPGHLWDSFANALQQNLADLQLSPDTVLVLDSESTDGTAMKALSEGFRVLPVARARFDHGRTRQLGAAHESTSSILIFLTQDALLANPYALRTLLTAFEDPTICAAYGRQLPRKGATAIEAHGRLFSYSTVSRVRALADRYALGFKSIFASNAFCGFRRDALLSVGGFPDHVICSEETIAIAKMHLAGWRSAYVADAQVFHSHPYTIAQEFKRYFDVGVTHARWPFLLTQFGAPTGEGKRFVKSEFRFLMRQQPLLLPSALLRTLTKFAGYRLGRREASLSPGLFKRFTMNPAFWLQDQGRKHHPLAVMAYGPDSFWDENADATPLQGSSSVIPQKLEAKPDLRRAGQFAAEVPRVSPVQQQRFR
jgi:rhamnosyltransferase